MIYASLILYKLSADLLFGREGKITEKIAHTIGNTYNRSWLNSADYSICKVMIAKYVTIGCIFIKVIDLLKKIPIYLSIYQNYTFIKSAFLIN